MSKEEKELMEAFKNLHGLMKENYYAMQLDHFFEFRPEEDWWQTVDNYFTSRE